MWHYATVNTLRTAKQTMAELGDAAEAIRAATPVQGWAEHMATMATDVREDAHRAANAIEMLCYVLAIIALGDFALKAIDRIFR